VGRLNSTLGVVRAAAGGGEGGGGGGGWVPGILLDVLGFFTLLGFLAGVVVFCEGTAGIGFRLDVDGNKKFWLLLEFKDFCDL